MIIESGRFYGVNPSQIRRPQNLMPDQIFFSDVFSKYKHVTNYKEFTPKIFDKDIVSFALVKKDFFNVKRSRCFFARRFQHYTLARVAANGWRLGAAAADTTLAAGY